MILRAARPIAGLLLFALALCGRVEARPARLLGPDGTVWFGPLPPPGGEARLPGRGVAGADPVSGDLWLEVDDLVVSAEPAPLRLGRVWEPDGWRWRGVSTLSLSIAGATWERAGAQRRAFPPIWPDPSQPSCPTGYQAHTSDAVLTCLEEGYQVDLPGGATERFDLDGHLLERRAPAGDTLKLGWVQGELAWIEGVWGGRVTFGEAVVIQGRRVRMATGPAGQQARYEWDDAGHLTAVTGADGMRARYHYDAEGALQGVVWSDGSSLEVQRDDAGRVGLLAGPGAARWRYEWGAGGLERAWDGRGLPWRVQRRQGEITVTDPTGHAATLLQGEAGVLGWRDPAGRTTHLSRDEAGRPILLHDANGGRWSLSWDTQGRLVQVNDPTGGRWRLLRDDEGHSLRVVDPVGRSRTYLLDEAGRVTEISDGLLSRRFPRDTAGLVRQIGRGTSSTTHIERDAAGRVETIVDAVGAQTRLSGHTGVTPGRITDAGGGVWKLAFNLLGQVAGLDAPDGSHIDWTRTPGGLLALVRRDQEQTRLGRRQDGAITRLTDPLGRVTGWALDAMGRARSVFQADGTRIEIGRDAWGALRSLALGGRRVELRRDALGRPTELAEGAPGATTPLLAWHRDPAGRLDRVTWPAGGLAFARDMAGLVRTVALGEQAWNLERDLAGRVVRVSLGEQTWALQRDNVGRVVEVQGPDGGIALEVDPRGLPRQADTLGLRARWRRDGAGRPVQVEGPGAVILGIQRDEAGHPTLLRLPDGVLLKAGLERGEQQLTMEDATGALLFQAQVGQDALGRPTAIRGDGGARQIRYGPLGEITSVEQADGAWSVFPGRREGPPGTLAVTTDPEGRPLEATIDGDASAWGVAWQTLRWARDAQDRVTAIEGDAGIAELAHDPLGRLIAVRVRDPAADTPLASFTLRWDPFGRPEVIEGPGGRTLLRYHEGRLLGLREGGRPALLLEGGLGLQVVAGPESHSAQWAPAGAGFELAWASPLQRRLDHPSPGGARDPTMPGGLAMQGRLQLFPGGPLVGPSDALDPVTGLPTAAPPGALSWAVPGWPDPAVQVRWPEPDGAAEAPWDPARWGRAAPWDDPLALLVVLELVAPAIPGPWWTPGSTAAPLPWLPASIEGRPPALLPEPAALPLAEEPLTARFLQAALSPREAPEVGEVLRLLLAADLAALPPTVPGAVPVEPIPHPRRGLP
ncbi:MAG: hypothetical protein ABIO70_34325 [Pseudomonadota bacterium]